MQLQIAVAGVLFPLSGAPFTAGESPSAVAVEPAGRFVYVIQSGLQDIAAYAIDAASGSLTSLLGFPLLVGNPPSSLTTTGSPQSRGSPSIDVVLTFDLATSKEGFLNGERDAAVGRLG
jgi:DNA-binding beta-propeller fold protein YncE